MGLLVGKQIGIKAASWIVIQFRVAAMPANVIWRQFRGLSILARVGFTRALFVSDLAIIASFSADVPGSAF